MPGEDITAIIEGHQGPTIDGRVYHSPAFQAQLEEYHAAALQAHKVSDRVAIPAAGSPDLEPVHIAAATRYASTSNGDHEPPFFGGASRKRVEEGPDWELLRAPPEPSEEQPSNGNAASDPN